MIARKKIATFWGTAAALVLCSINSSMADSAAEVVAIHSVDQVWIKAYNTADVETLVGLYDEHAVLLPPGAPAVRGRAAIRAFFVKDAAASAKDGITMQIGPKPDGGVSGDMGWASGTYTATDKSGHVVDTGKYLSVSKKSDGKWRYVRDTWNSDGPSAPPAPPAKK
jgi:uncharacterized protein (TIGR02246 family)